jgi:hypothetical protein
MQLVIAPDGSARAIYSEEFALEALGVPRIVRASTVAWVPPDPDPDPVPATAEPETATVEVAAVLVRLSMSVAVMVTVYVPVAA